MEKPNKDENKPTYAEASAAKAESKTLIPESQSKPSWQHINTDLKTALDTWDDLTDKMANKISPEEKQLREIKSILGTLKDKLKEFSEDEKK